MKGGSFLSPSGTRGTDVEKHTLVLNDNFKQKMCQYCKMEGTRTVSGWVVLTQMKCSVCNVPLCRGKTRPYRQCFQLFHEKHIFNKK